MRCNLQLYMKIVIQITPDENLTESDFQAIQARAAKQKQTVHQWTADALRAALMTPEIAGNNSQQVEVAA